MSVTTPTTSTCTLAPVMLSIEGTPSNQGSTITCYAHALAAQVHMALKTRKQCQANQVPVPRVDEIRERLLAKYPPELQCVSWTLHNILDAMPVLYPPLLYRMVDETQAYKILLLEKRPVLVWIGLRHWEAQYLERRCGMYQGPNVVVTRLEFDCFSRYCSEAYKAKGFAHVVLLTGYDPATGMCTFLNSRGPDWGDNGHFRIENMAVLTSRPEACILFVDVYAAEAPKTLDSKIHQGRP
ncbi:hypothetical protein V8F33_011929 [Rhypophila sp. PSN 637]